MANRREFTLQTDREGFYDITAQVQEALRESGIDDGLCIVFSPHTTAAITINENADHEVTRDLRFALDQTYPYRPEFRHAEGNSSAHLKASCIGSSETIIVQDRKLLLGIWQGIYFCEFDGPRSRKFYVKIIAG